ncbi:MFS transporter [Novosphingobium mathurense]|uniref:Nucleoside transporter n=1 Tax=Novosphingobium mathurense TaxID=428990 RepID=A0A1U6IXP0_9SPHN|nr:MFS transporter [Novosphingobium mathurense]SLK12795.1 nucleoside transporter [Novosphingobium mathurense]
MIARFLLNGGGSSAPNLAIFWRLRCMMFFYYVAFFSWLTPLSTYMSKTLGFDDIIGTAYSMVGVAVIGAGLFVGMVADRYFSTERVFAFLSLGAAVSLFWLSRIDQSREIFLAVMLLHCVFYTSMLPLTVAISMNALSDPVRQYPAIRVFGTAGAIVAGLIIGLWPGAAESRIPMLIGATTYLFLAPYSLSLPPRRPSRSTEKLNLIAIFGLDFVRDNKNPIFWVFMIAIMAMVIPKKFYDSFLNNFLHEMSVRFDIFSLQIEPTAVQTSGLVIEIITILAIPFFISRIGIKWVMVLGMCGWIGRFILFSTGSIDGHAVLWMLILGVLLHGVSYDFLFTSGQIWLDNRCDPQTRGRAQAFYNFMMLGPGAVIGANVAGAIYNMNTNSLGLHDWSIIWLAPAGVALIAMALFIALFRDDGRKFVKREMASHQN